MNCPNCDTTLVMSERQGVEIDYCPQCRGVWLDRGELDKIIERSLPVMQAPQSNDQAKARKQRDDDDRYDDKRYDDGDKYYKKKKRKSLLEEIFDF